jgi:hypothetical protein
MMHIDQVHIAPIAAMAHAKLAGNMHMARAEALPHDIELLAILASLAQTEQLRRLNATLEALNKQ